MSTQPRTVEVTRTYLQLPDRAAFIASFLPDTEARVERATECPASFYRYLYREVGRFYHWVDRLGWSDETVRAHLGRDEISLWVMYLAGAPAGYFELERHADGSVEIAYFGLLPEYLGRGLGRHLLSVAVEQAWNEGARRVWLHTCTLDDPAALPNYLKRGFQPFKEEKYTTTIGADEVLRRSGEWGVGACGARGEWGVREKWGVGSGEWGVGSAEDASDDFSCVLCPWRQQKGEWRRSGGVGSEDALRGFAWVP